MAITYNWTVTQLLVYPEDAGETDVVTTVAWNCDATDGTYSASTGGSVPVKLDPTEPFTPYNKLTQEQVLGWVFTVLVPDIKLDIENGLAMQIERQARQIQPKPLPW